jgi:hypothetical protein
MSNLKFVRAMFTSREWNSAIGARKSSGQSADRGAGGRGPRGQRRVTRFVPSSTWPTPMGWPAVVVLQSFVDRTKGALVRMSVFAAFDGQEVDTPLKRQ